MVRKLRRITLVLTIAALPGWAGADTEALGRALDALADGNTTEASQALTQIDDPIARDVVLWRQLRRGGMPWSDYTSFLERNDDWPGLSLLRARGETAIPGDADPAAVIAYFAEAAPRTGQGALALARALEATGDRAAAEAEVVRAWTELEMTGTAAGNLRSAYSSVLNDGDLHEQRLDFLLWENAEERARAMFPLVPEAYHALAEARLALRARRPGVDGLIERVPADLRDDPGLAFERFLWRITSGFWDTAGELMQARSTSAAALGRPSAWADRRADLARDVMREGDFDTCYDYASTHFVTQEEDYLAFAELEWISGYCAFRLGDFPQAISHFEAFSSVVFSPISVGRAGYWLGRAHEAAGNETAAAEAYALGAQYQSSFYGQLAAERGGLPTDPAFLGTEDFGDWRGADFTSSEVFHAGLMLYEAGQYALAERFLTHLTEGLSRQEAGQLGNFALEIGDAHLALRIAKRAAQNGFEIMRAYYPIAELAEQDLPVPTALALSIARRESEFDPGVISGAGALGLMQVMPGTGRDTARALGLTYSQQRLLDDPDYNLLLGSTYIAGLIEQFDGNPVLVSVGYNAGPGRARQWLERFGDPRDAEDITFWIEAIPFSETRNYIMRVTESFAIYEAQLTGELRPPELAARLQR
jgi:soluble lytic murein transglycosylase